MRIPEFSQVITLHQAIKRIINEYGPATVSEITTKVNEKGLYRRRDGNSVPANQVSARIRKYPHMFVRESGKVYIGLSL